MIYYGLTLIFKDDFDDYIHFYMIVFACFFSCINFIVRVESASRIHAASLLVKYESRKLRAGRGCPDSTYLRFLENSREITMTVWGFVNVRRNIILGTFGTIITYSLLFDDLINY